MFSLPCSGGWLPCCLPSNGRNTVNVKGTGGGCSSSDLRATGLIEELGVSGLPLECQECSIILEPWAMWDFLINENRNSGLWFFNELWTINTMMRQMCFGVFFFVFFNPLRCLQSFSISGKAQSQHSLGLQVICNQTLLKFILHLTFLAIYK